MNEENPDIDITPNSQLILNRLSANFYTTVNNKITRVTNAHPSLLDSSRRNRRRLSAHLKSGKTILGKRLSGGSSSTTPSCNKPSKRYSLLHPGSRGDAKKAFRTKQLKAEGNVKYLNSLGKIWGTNSNHEFCQFHQNKKTALFKLKGRYTKNPLRLKNSKNKVCLLNSNSKIEIMDSRNKKRLIRTPIADHRSRVTISEFHLDPTSTSCYVNYDNFYSMIKVSLKERKITKFDLKQGQKGGKLYCRTSFLPLQGNNLIFAHNTSKFTSDKLKIKLEVVSLKNNQTQFTKNCIEFETPGDPNGDVGKLINIDPVNQKFVHVICDKIKYYQLQENGTLKLIAEHKEKVDQRKQVLQVVLQTIQN